MGHKFVRANSDSATFQPVDLCGFKFPIEFPDGPHFQKPECDQDDEPPFKRFLVEKPMKELTWAIIDEIYPYQNNFGLLFPLRYDNLVALSGWTCYFTVINTRSYIRTASVHIEVVGPQKKHYMIEVPIYNLHHFMGHWQYLSTAMCILNEDSLGPRFLFRMVESPMIRYCYVLFTHIQWRVFTRAGQGFNDEDLPVPTKKAKAIKEAECISVDSSAEESEGSKGSGSYQLRSSKSKGTSKKSDESMGRSDLVHPADFLMFLTEKLDNTTIERDIHLLVAQGLNSKLPWNSGPKPQAVVPVTLLFNLITFSL